MKFGVYLLLMVSGIPLLAVAQDSTGSYVTRNVQLDEVVVEAARLGFDVPEFIRLVEEDTTFYKAFKTLRILSYTSDNDIRIFDKKDEVRASLKSDTRQTVQNGCRTMKTLNEKTTGDFYDRKKRYNYYTAELYASLFFTEGKVCGENNIVKGDFDSAKEHGSLARHKEQLKELMFNPGQPISGLPFVGNKVAIFDDAMAPLYNFSITSSAYEGTSCYVFTATAKPYHREEVVINKLVTYFSKENFEIVARDYSLSYSTFVFDFDVHMQVQMTHFATYMIPSVIHYSGNWKVPFKKREHAVFTTRFSDFKRQ